MKRMIFVFLALFAIAGCEKKEEAKMVEVSKPLPPPARQTAVAPVAVAPFKTFYVYADKNSPDNHFIPSGWMGDHADIKLAPDSKEDPHAGATCIEITYNNKASGGARWAGVYWLDPENNWGQKENAGFDLTGAKRLTFWIRGDKGTERIEEMKMGGIHGNYPDSDTAGIGPVVLTKEWKQYAIDLTGKDLSHIIGGFCWSTNLDANPQGCTFYLDEIRYE